MKTVIVFDTEDPKGMASTVQIVEHLAEQYMNQPISTYDESFGKIEFIKTIRVFMKEADELAVQADRTTLLFAKRFADKVWKAKKGKKVVF
jgi:hypothetical protein